MANQMHPDKRRASTVVNEADFNTLEKAANSIGLTVSVMFKEAAFRLAEEIRSRGQIEITQAAKKPTKPGRKPFERFYVFIVDNDDYQELKQYASTLGASTSFLIREGVDRLVRGIQKTGKIKFERPFDAQEGESKPHPHINKKKN